MSESFAQLFEESLQRTEMRPGEVITAEVVRVEHNFVVVNDKVGVVTGSTLKMPPTDNAYVKDVREGSARALAEVASPGSVAALEAAFLMATAEGPEPTKGPDDAGSKARAGGAERPKLRDPRPVEEHRSASPPPEEDASTRTHNPASEQEDDMPAEIEIPVDDVLRVDGEGDRRDVRRDRRTPDDDMPDTFEEGTPS